MMGAVATGSRAKLSLAICSLVLLALSATDSGAERAQDGNLIVSLNGGITPRALPRQRPAPVSVHLAGRVQTSDKAPLPRVNWIRLELAWRGQLDTYGLPVCPRVRLIGADSRQAVERCDGAQVGRGRLLAKIFLPNQSPIEIDADLVAFNGRTKSGRTAVLVHAYATKPPVSFTIPFSVHHSDGGFRTVLVALIRRSAGPWPHVANFQIDIARTFNLRGQRHSYLKASCPVPKQFTAGFLSFARATYTFAGGKQMTIESVRSCRAR
jgi:hypothetical protein